MIIRNLAHKYRNAWWAKFVKPIWYPIKYRNKKKNYKTNATEVLLKAKFCLENAGLFFWLDFGTLLGAYREKDFIKHDLDIDISLFAKDIQAVYKAMTEGNFKLEKKYEDENDPTITEHTYSFQGVAIDIFFYKEAGNLMYCHSFFWHKEDDYLNDKKAKAAIKKVFFPNNGFTTLPFKGEIFNVPKNIEQYLATNYGTTFMTPDKKFDFFKTSKNITYYSKLEKVGIYTIYE